MTISRPPLARLTVIAALVFMALRPAPGAIKINNNFHRAHSANLNI
jgi:hypothetical protein